MKFEKGNSKVILGIGIVVVVILGTLVYLLSTSSKQATTTQDNKISSVPSEIKTPQEATDLQKDTANIVNEIDDTLSNIEDSLPDV